ncbi:hypothetical protein LZK76_36585 (plasmid) [Rhizobium leguminosarum]|nr:hypothetical protein LZK76_36585 [Rhizobium leguminosarum]
MLRSILGEIARSFFAVERDLPQHLNENGNVGARGADSDDGQYGIARGLVDLDIALIQVLLERVATRRSR